MSDIIIELKGIKKCFEQESNPALRDCNLSISEGQMVAIIGTSGSGKSTLLSILGLLDQATSGEYYLCGTDISKLSETQKSVLRNKHIGWIFQNFNLVANMNTIENVILPLRYNSNFSKSKYLELAIESLKELNMEHKWKSFPHELSGGEQQRVAIARALITQPDIILCDEPTGNLDTQNSKTIISLLKQLNDTGKTILLVTHDMEIAKKCKRQIEVIDGCLTNV